MRRDLGVPRYLPPQQAFRVVQSRAQPNTLEDPVATSAHADLLWTSPPQPPRDYCAELRRTGGGAPGAPGAPGTPDAPPHPDTLPHQ